MFNCIAQLQEDVLEKTVTHIHVLSYLEEDASVTREMIYVDAILFFHCLLPDAHLGFNLLLLRYSEEQLCSECSSCRLCTLPVGSSALVPDHWACQGVLFLDRACQ